MMSADRALQTAIAATLVALITAKTAVMPSNFTAWSHLDRRASRPCRTLAPTSDQSRLSIPPRTIATQLADQRGIDGQRVSLKHRFMKHLVLVQHPRMRLGVLADPLPKYGTIDTELKSAPGPHNKDTLPFGV